MTLKRKWWFFVLTNKASTLVPPFFLPFLLPPNTSIFLLTPDSLGPRCLRAASFYSGRFLPSPSPDLVPPHFPQLRSSPSQKTCNSSFST